MTKRFIFSACLALFVLLFSQLQQVVAQAPGTTVKGVVLESGTGLPLRQVSISVLSTGVSAETDSLGAFAIEVPGLQELITIDLPGYVKRNIFLNGREMLTVSLVASQFKSMDNSYNSPLGAIPMKDATSAVATVNATDLSLTKASSYEQALQGRITGLHVINQSGMPGVRSMMSLRGFSSMLASNEPLLFIDGMIHEYSYAKNSLMEGFALNPMDIVDVDDIVDISVIKDGDSYLGAAGSNGIININTEQKAEASTIIKISTYTGVGMMPSKMSVLNSSQFKTYFQDVLNEQGYSSTDINTMYPWLNGDNTATDYYRYNNSTDWQDQIFKPTLMQKYHIFLKGGDDIATYNISTGYLKHKGLYEESSYSRFNLRINGKINITDKFSVTPNVKLSLADSYLPNQGFNTSKNPILASLLMPPITQPNARDIATGTELPYLDDVTLFNVSNPVALINNAIGTNRNYHFLSSVTAAYRFNRNLTISNLTGIDFNNSRENIFLPSLGLVKTDSVRNSPGDLINEFRSTQNHTTITFTNTFGGGHSLLAQAGFRIMRNQFKYDKAIDFNTPSDDFKNLGKGISTYPALRTTTGDYRGLLWTSYFANVNYNFRDKYFLNANLSYDGNSAINKNNRFNFFPSVSGAWRVSSESFMSQASWLDDLKLRASWGVTGNMFSEVYDFSKLYYISSRLGSTGVLTREVIPNEEMEVEKKQTIDLGADLSVMRQALNLHFDYFQSKVDNLLTYQTLPPTYGYREYFDNGGKLSVKGIEVAADYRIQAGALTVILGGSVSKAATTIESFEFINASESFVLTSVEGAQYIARKGGPINAFYGYKTLGIYQDNATANAVTGPRGYAMQAGDVIYAEKLVDNIIDENDMDIIGDPNPDLFGGFTAFFSYKNIQLNAFFNYSLGNDAFNYVKYQTESMSTYSNQSADVLNRWTSGTPSTTMPRASIGDPTGNTVFSDRWIEDASYVRLKQLTLSYDLPSVSGVYKGIKIYITGTNLLTFTKYTGYDPDFQYMSSPFYMGADYGSMPQTRSFILGLKLDL
ncbi:MAG: SusC/RagA family TonB-linked outer membrane protein [Bacteroidales bacterium]